MEVLVVLIIALVIFGPKRLPELGKSLGNGIKEFKGSISGEHGDESTPAHEVEATPPKPAVVETVDAEVVGPKP